MGYAIGAQVPLPYVVRDSGGNLVDVTTMTITVTQPNGVDATPLTIGSGITRQSLGTYLGIFTPTQAGRHTWSGISTGPATALEPDAFNVTAAADAPLVGLAEARAWLNIDRPDWDGLIRRSVAKATEVVEWWTGETVRRTTIQGETHDGGGRHVRLWRNPVISVTRAVEGSTVLTTSGTDWTLDSDAGLLYRGGAQSEALWLSGLRTVVVDYVAGYAIVPDRYLGAVEELTRLIFNEVQGAGSDRAEDEYDDRSNPSIRRICAILLGPRMSSF